MIFTTYTIQPSGEPSENSVNLLHIHQSMPSVNHPPPCVQRPVIVCTQPRSGVVGYGGAASPDSTYHYWATEPASPKNRSPVLKWKRSAPGGGVPVAAAEGPAASGGRAHRGCGGGGARRCRGWPAGQGGRPSKGGGGAGANPCWSAAVMWVARVV